MTKPRVVFVHGNGAMSWKFAWTPWFKQQLETLDYTTFFETMPDSIIARAEFWLPFLHDYAHVDKEDILVGWSSGAVAAMRYCETNAVKGLILISPSCTDLGDELEKQSGYFDTPWNWQAIKSNAPKIALFYGTDDPYISQTEFNNIAEKLTPKTLPVDGGKHFIERTDFTELLTYIKSEF